MDISKLFKWKKEYTIVDQDDNPIHTLDGEEIKVYIRIIGDNDLDRARKYALRQTRKLRADYRLDSSGILPDFNEFDEDQLASLIVLNEAAGLYKQAERDTQIKYPVSKDSYRLEDAETYVKDTDEYFEKLAEKVDEEAQILIQQRLEYYKTLPHVDLVRRAETAYIDKIIDQDMVKLVNDAILYYAVYEDEECTKKVFESIDEVRNAAPILKEQLYREYTTLVLSDLDLKK